MTYKDYYSSFDQDIQSIRGSGVITPNTNNMKTSTSSTISDRIKDNVEYAPPLYPKQIIAQNKIATSGYLNENNYLVEDRSDIKKYYYPTQQIDDLNLIEPNKKLEKELNDDYAIKMPAPPIINRNLTKHDIEFLNTIKDNSFIQDKFIYTIDTDDDQISVIYKDNEEYIPCPKNKKQFIEHFDITDDNTHYTVLIIILLLLIMLFFYNRYK